MELKEVDFYGGRYIHHLLKVQHPRRWNLVLFWKLVLPKEEILVSR